MADIVLGCHAELRLEKNIHKGKVHLWTGKTTLLSPQGVCMAGKKHTFVSTRCIYGREKPHFFSLQGAFMAGENHIFGHEKNYPLKE